MLKPCRWVLNKLKRFKPVDTLKTQPEYWMKQIQERGLHELTQDRNTVYWDKFSTAELDRYFINVAMTCYLLGSTYGSGRYLFRDILPKIYHHQEHLLSVDHFEKVYPGYQVENTPWVTDDYLPHRVMSKKEWQGYYQDLLAILVKTIKVNNMKLKYRDILALLLASPYHYSYQVYLVNTTVLRRDIDQAYQTLDHRPPAERIVTRVETYHYRRVLTRLGAKLEDLEKLTYLDFVDLVEPKRNHWEKGELRKWVSHNLYSLTLYYPWVRDRNRNVKPVFNTLGIPLNQSYLYKLNDVIETIFRLALPENSHYDEKRRLMGSLFDVDIELHHHDGDNVMPV